jgi:Tol biopolymer transport system component
MTGGIGLRGLACAALAAAGLVLLAGAGPARAGVTKRVSVSSKGAQGDDDSGNFGVAISADGRFVAFDSYATTLVPGDTNGVPDIFVRDRVRGTTERVSLGPHGVQAEGGKGEGSYGPSISGNGRFVAFSSYATNLVAGDTNGFEDVFVRDRELGTTERVSVGPHGRQSDNASQGAAISADGRFVVFQSDATNLVRGGGNGQIGVYVRDRARGVTELVSVGPRGTRADDASFIGAISADGRLVAFGSFADNLVPDDTNGSFDTFVRDRLRGTTERVSVASDGTQGNGGSGGPSISANGRYVAFSSEATNLVPGDTNRTEDVFVHHR